MSAHICKRLSTVVPCAEEQMLKESWGRAAVEGFSAAAEGFARRRRAPTGSDQSNEVDRG